MVLAKEENGVKTYAEWKDEYLSLKAVLHVFGVNLAEIEGERNQDFGAYGKARNPG